MKWGKWQWESWLCFVIMRIMHLHYIPFHYIPHGQFFHRFTYHKIRLTNHGLQNREITHPWRTEIHESWTYFLELHESGSKKRLNHESRATPVPNHSCERYIFFELKNLKWENINPPKNRLDNQIRF